MKIKFLLLSLGLFVFSTVMAQKKNTATKTIKTSTTTGQTTSNNPLYQQAETQVITTKSIVTTAPLKADIVENKYQMIIDQNLSMINEIDKKIEEKKIAYGKEKLKNNSSISTELTEARFQMIAEIIGPDAANYYIKKH